MKFSLRTLFLLLLGIGGAIGTVAGFVDRNPSSIVVGDILMMLGIGGFVASTWRDKSDLSGGKEE